MVWLVSGGKYYDGVCVLYIGFVGKYFASNRAININATIRTASCGGERKNAGGGVSEVVSI